MFPIKFSVLCVCLFCFATLLGCASTSTRSELPTPTPQHLHPSEDDAKDTDNAIDSNGAVVDDSEKHPDSSNVTETASENGETALPGTTVVPEEPGIQEVEKVVPSTPASLAAQAGDYDTARRLALEDARQNHSEDLTEFWSYVDDDPLMSHSLIDEIRPHGTNAISALGGGSTVSFKYTDSADESAKAALKPDQDLRQTMYRSGIAFYRLCQILGCHFQIPVTRHAQFSRSDFNALYSASTSPKNKAYRAKFDHLIWDKSSGTPTLHLAYKEWIPSFGGFPIENTRAWSSYLDPRVSEYPSLDKFMNKIYEYPNSRRNVKKALSYLEGLTTRDILQQISDLILVDYLTNNWDRFSGAADNYGANCHITTGGIIAIDNDAAFPAWHAPRVVKRLHFVRVFSRTLVENLRLLNPHELISRLIPDPTREELKSYERFKERRKDALHYIDNLIQKYGEDAVLAF